MRSVRAVLACILFAGCEGAALLQPQPPPPMAFDECIARLFRYPEDPGARAIFPSLLEAQDDETMRTMRYYHGTGENQMNHNYPSHRWIHPFLRGCRLEMDGVRDQAEFAFESARTAALNARPWYDGTDELRLIIAEESWRRIQALQAPR